MTTSTDVAQLSLDSTVAPGEHVDGNNTSGDRSMPTAPRRPRRARTSPTSEAARSSNAPRSPSQRERVFNLVYLAEPIGSTRKLIAAALCIGENSVNARVRELVVAGYCTDTGTGVLDSCARVRVLKPAYDAEDVARRLKCAAAMEPARA